MGDFQKIAAVPVPRRVAELTPEAQSFKTFKVRAARTETSSVAALAFSPEGPHHRLAVVSGTKVGFWQKKDGGYEAHAQVSKFKDVTQCVAWRGDGRLLLAGEASGSCAVVEAETRKVLRRFRGHGGDAVTCAAFASADRSRAATGGKDGKLRVWDVTTSELLLEIAAHADVIKSLAPGPGGSDNWISAGYDGRIKVWDFSGITLTQGGEHQVIDTAAAEKYCVANANHGQQVEQGVCFPGGSLYASVGGTALKIWDLALGGKLLKSVDDAHSKAITSVSLDSTAACLLTASVDGLAKVYNAADLSHLWTYRLPGPAMCAAWRPDDNCFVVGMADGQWQLRERKTMPATKALQKALAVAAKEQQSYKKREGRLRGRDAVAGSDDEVMDMHKPDKKRKITRIDWFLKTFDYRKVLEHLVTDSTGPGESLAIVDELLQRGSLRVALSNVGEALCRDLLKWVHKVSNSGDSLREHLVWELLHTLLDTNPCLQPPSTPELVDLFSKIENKIIAEMKVQEALFETSGMLDVVMNL